MNSLLFTLMLASAANEMPPEKLEPISVLVLELQSSKVNKEEVAVLNDIVGQSVSQVPKSEVVTAADVRRVADVEAQKQLMGCDDSSCLVDLADDFGARFIVFGSVALLGQSYVVQLTLFDSEKAAVVNRSRFEGKDLTGVTRKIDDSVREIFSPVREIPPRAMGKRSFAGLYTAGAGVAVVGVGAAALVFAVGQNGVHSDLQGEIVTLENGYKDSQDAAEREILLEQAGRKSEDATAARNNANRASIAGASIVAIGTMVVTAGVIWFLSTSEAE